MKRLGITIGILLFGLILFAQTTPQDAMQAALQKLEQAQKDGDAKEEAAALCDVATADLMAGLDAEAEDYASRAEKNPGKNISGETKRTKTLKQKAKSFSLPAEALYQAAFASIGLAGAAFASHEYS